MGCGVFVGVDREVSDWSVLKIPKTFPSGSGSSSSRMGVGVGVLVGVDVGPGVGVFVGSG